MITGSMVGSMLTIGALCLIVDGAAAQTAPYPSYIYGAAATSPAKSRQLCRDVRSDAHLDDPVPKGVRSAAQALGSPIEASVTTIPVALADIVTHDHAIAVHRSADEIGTSVACGELSGFEPGVADIQVRLGDQDGSVARGVAWLHDNGDGTTTVTIVIGPSAAVAATATNADVAAAIREFLYLPDSLEIPAGATVTWTNEDLTPHTTTATEGTFDSGYMAQWDSFSHTFATPGTFDYFCAFHPRMRATVTVR